MNPESIFPEKSPNDQRLYEAIELSNKLKVLFIHDQQIAKSACSISVGVGSLFDKDRSLGLAHFLEHMLFMGSKKFPSHNEYSSFISTNSGFDNAYTSDLQTNYYFQIKNSSFFEAAERLANFFNGALLKEQCIQKESQAVHQQFVLWTNDDNCRKWEILRKLASPPYSRFNIGNTETLRHQNIRQDLVQFYQHYYSSNIINAVFCSNFTIEEMKKIIIPFLEAIPNKQVQIPKLDLHYKDSQTGKLIRMQSIKDEVIVQFFWVVQILRPFYKKHISDYITHVLGHEGKNSLLSILKKKKYASELSAYSHDLKNQTMIGVQIKLTEDGQENYTQVYNITMDYISNLRCQAYIFEEIKQKKLIQFQFKQKSKISDYVCRLSSKMHYVPLTQVLNSASIFQGYDQEAINRILSQLNPFNVIVVLSSSEQLENSLTEKYLGAKYVVESLPQRQKSGLDFAPIPINKYIPINTGLTPNLHPTKTPQKISQNIYFLQDSTFKVCKGGIELRIYSKQSFQFLEFYSSYLNLLLKQLTYPAEALDCKIEYDSDDCLIITIFGFNDTALKMLAQISDNLHKLHSGEESKVLFQVALDDLIEEYQNFYNQQSDEVATDTLDILLSNQLKTIQKAIEQFEGYQYEDVLQRIKSFWNQNRFKWVIVGNFEKDNMVTFINKVEVNLRGNSHIVEPRVQKFLKLNKNIGHEIVLQSEELSSSCSIVYYQAGPYTQDLYYKLLLLKNHIDEPFFNELRTQKQMAYYLGVRIENSKGILGLWFILVSSTRDPKNISEQIKGFVNNFFGKLQTDLSGENSNKLIKIKESVETKIKAPHNNLKSLFQFIVEQIDKQTFYFNRKDEAQIKKHLEKISVGDLIQIWDLMKNQTLEVYVVSKAHLEAYKKYGFQSPAIEEIQKNSLYWDLK